MLFSSQRQRRAIMERPNTEGRCSNWTGRTYRRFELEFPVRLKFQSGRFTEEVEGVSKNLSIGGLLVRSALPVAQHTLVTFVLSVHGHHSLRRIHLTGGGEIVRVEIAEAEGAFMMAVKCGSPVVELEEFLPSTN
jgi:hypothetical protein